MLTCTEPKQILKTPHLLTIIRAVEDLQTVTPAVYDQAAALFSASIQNSTSGSQVSSQELAKSVAGLGKSTMGFEMVNSNGGLQAESGSVVLSASGAEVKRGWDWRKGATAMRGRNVGPEDVLRVLRTQVAKEMAKVWG